MPNTGNRRVLITGVTRGLGRAMAQTFSALGHTVIGCGRSPGPIEELHRTHPGHDFAVVDVADGAAVAAWAEEVLRRHGPPDLLLNNAALINSNAVLWEVSAEEFDRLIDVNIKGIANVIRAFVP